jgi:Tfp pilus assembly protein PilO
MWRSLTPLASLAALSLTLAVSVHVFYSETSATRLAEAETAYQAAKAARESMLKNRQIQTRAKEAQRELETIWKTLPTHKDFTNLALDLSELGRAEGVLIPGMNYTLKSEKEQTVATEATVSFQATGTYPAIYRFIHQLEHQSTYLVIDKLDVRRLAQSNKSMANMVSLNVTLTTYLKPSKMNVGT